MFTAHPNPGKFEGNSSQLLAEVVYQASLDGVSTEWSFGNDGSVDWSGLVEGKRFSFIVHNDGQGFVDVGIYDRRNPDDLNRLKQFILEMDGALKEIDSD